jgi:DNA-binding CsgD family transcriptional regulator
MTRLCHADLDRVVRLGGELAAAEEAEPFPARILESLRQLIRSDRAGYCELDRIDRRLLAQCGVPEDDDAGPDEGIETYWRLRHQYAPCVYEDRTGDFSPNQLSDFISIRELRRLEIYSALFRPSGIEYEIAVGLPAPLTHTKMFLFSNGPRHGDFGERERTILELLRPYLASRSQQVRAMRRAETALAVIDDGDEALVLLDGSGRAEFATARALRLLGTHGHDLSDVPNIDPLIAQPLRPDVLLISEQRPLGLTTRERQILALVAEGRTNNDVAAALWISPATVGKHLENAYMKLNVSSRTAAVERARRHGALGSP